MLNNYPDILTLKDFCDILRISKSTAYKILRSNEVRNRKIAGKFIITKQNMIEYLCA